MLGNFSFGDYFKEDAVAFALGVRHPGPGHRADRLAATVFNGEKGIPWDEEAARLWKRVGVPESRILRLGEKDNFWAMGDTGPCGPCSEIHYHQGDDIPCAEEAAGRKCLGVACECDRWMEMWNLVFMQFERKEKDARSSRCPGPPSTPAPGLERVTAVVQGKRRNYDTDLFVPLLGEGRRALGEDRTVVTEWTDASMRVIADHCPGDGVPDRRRRAALQRGPRLRAPAHHAARHPPRLQAGAGRAVPPRGGEGRGGGDGRGLPRAGGERRPSSSRRRGTRRSPSAARSTAGSSSSTRRWPSAKAARQVLSGDVVFLLHDTHGFPWDLTQVIARERGFDVDLDRLRGADGRSSGSAARSAARARRRWRDV